MNLLFQLGHQPHLSAAEIRAVLAMFGLDYTLVTQTKTHLVLVCKTTVAPSELMQYLGGTVSIAESVPNAGEPGQTMADFLDQHQTGKIHFSVHGPAAERLALATKKILKAAGRSVRYIKANNTATILHNNLVEKQGDFTLLDTHIYVTRAIQPLEAFARRDYDRPRADDKSGMLPPKLARIMINLGLGALKRPPAELTILDPFCGSGTILLEAATLGFKKIMGSDAAGRAVNDSQKNINWLLETQKQDATHPYTPSSAITITQTDVRELPAKLPRGSIDLIVFEPYLGKPLHGNEPRSVLTAQAHVLAELYQSAFTALKQILSPGGVIIAIIPRFSYQEDWIDVDCLPAIKQTGFAPLSLFADNETLLYHRPGQHVGRMVVGLRLVEK